MIDTPKSNVLANIDKIVKQELDKGVIPSDAKWAIVTAVSNDGTKLLAAANFKINEDKIKVQIQAIWEHDWDGDDTMAGKVVFSGK